MKSERKGGGVRRCEGGRARGRERGRKERCQMTIHQIREAT